MGKVKLNATFDYITDIEFMGTPYPQHKSRLLYIRKIIKNYHGHKLVKFVKNIVHGKKSFSCGELHTSVAT